MKVTIWPWWESVAGHWYPMVFKDVRPDDVSLDETSIGAVVSGAALDLQLKELDEATATTKRIYGSADKVSVRLFEGTVILFHSHYDTMVRVSPEDYRRLLLWQIAIRDSPDYRNPDAEFEPIEIDYDTNVPADLIELIKAGEYENPPPKTPRPNPLRRLRRR